MHRTPQVPRNREIHQGRLRRPRSRARRPPGRQLLPRSRSHQGVQQEDLARRCRQEPGPRREGGSPHPDHLQRMLRIPVRRRPRARPRREAPRRGQRGPEGDRNGVQGNHQGLPLRRGPLQGGRNRGNQGQGHQPPVLPGRRILRMPLPEAQQHQGRRRPRGPQDPRRAHRGHRCQEHAQASTTPRTPRSWTS